MVHQIIILLLFYNVMRGAVVAYHNPVRIDYSDPRSEAKFRLKEPASDLRNMFSSSDDLKMKAQLEKLKPELENWTGRWMPDQVQPLTSALMINSQNNNIEIHHSVSMGNAFPDCDDGKRRLNLDWDNSPVNYTCYGAKITPSYSIRPEWYCEHIPPSYKAIHRCMNQTIEYDDNIPMYGTHRPVWPVYGEYKFLPRQRWIHSLEHGAVVMLYHPCANPLEVQQLKYLVTKCLRRHIITRYNLLDIEKPLALVTWGCRLTMSYVDEDLVARFINKKALHGPENIVEDGEFEEGLISVAQIVSDEADSQLCPRLE